MSNVKVVTAIIIIAACILFIRENIKTNRELILPKYYKEEEKEEDDYIFIYDIYELENRGKEMVKLIPNFPQFSYSVFSNFPIPKDKGKYGSIAERYSIMTLETLFPTYKFLKIRPNWLKNPKTNRNLELDGYCKELNIGIEYNGIQHYVYPNIYAKSKQDFKEQLYRDKIKKKMCKKEGVFLITVPYNIEYKNIPMYIYNILLKSVPRKIRKEIKNNDRKWMKKV